MAKMVATPIYHRVKFLQKFSASEPKNPFPQNFLRSILDASQSYSPLDDPGKKIFRCTPRGTKVVIYHLVGNFMLNSMQNVVSLATCAESL